MNFAIIMLPVANFFKDICEVYYAKMNKLGIAEVGIKKL